MRDQRQEQHLMSPNNLMTRFIMLGKGKRRGRKRKKEKEEKEKSYKLAQNICKPHSQKRTYIYNLLKKKKKLPKISNKNTNNLIKTLVENLNRHFTKKGKHMLNKHMKRH